MPGGGEFCFVFSTWGPEFCTEKLSRGGDFDGKKLVALGSPRGGMVTGQIDTCITAKPPQSRSCPKEGRNLEFSPEGRW